jgi:hypothetical protein
MKKGILGLIAACVLSAATTAGAQGIKWHPGHYVMLDGGSSLSGHFRQIDEIGNERNIEGVMIRIWWSDLETSWGRYDFSRIDSYIARLRRQSTTKRLVVRIMDRKFNTSSSWGIVPSYIRNNSQFNGGVVRTSNGYAARLWEPSVMNRLIALYQAIGRRYNYNPTFEGLFTEETTLSLRSPFPSGYSHSKLTQQYKRFVNAVKPEMQRSNLFMNANWIGSSSLMSDLVQELSAARVGAGGSNVIPGSKTLGQRAITGVYGADYRWDLAIANGVESGELGGNLGSFTPWQIANYAYNELHTHYLFWARNTWMGNSSQRWYTGILPYLRNNPPIRTRCPNSYGICDRS